MAHKPGIILAYDKSDFTDADRLLLAELQPHINYIKIGLEAMHAESPWGTTIARWVRDYAHSLGLKVMWDAKLHDIATTMENAARNIATNNRVHMLTLHASASNKGIAAVGKVCRDAGITALAVTVLTDIDDIECIRRYGGQSEDTVRDFAWLSYENGIRGMVCSPKEVRHIKEDKKICEMCCVVPGIRPLWAQANDQKRVTTPAEAAKAGADYLVIGRPILQPPDGMTPVEAAKRIREELDAV